MKLLALTGLLLLMACGDKGHKPEIVLDLRVLAKHRPFVEDKEKLGREAIDYSTLPGILAELIPEGTIVPAAPENHELIFSSKSDAQLYMAMRSGDTLTLVNRSHRPLILESYDMMGYGFPIYLGTEKDNNSQKLEIKRDCRNAIIFDHSDNFKICVTVNPYHKTYLRSGEFKTFGLREGAPLQRGTWKLRLTHPRFPPYEKRITLTPECSRQDIEYSLGALVTKSGEKGSLPYIP